jgi:hypothetical protein
VTAIALTANLALNLSAPALHSRPLVRDTARASTSFTSQSFPGPNRDTGSKLELVNAHALIPNHMDLPQFYLILAIKLSKIRLDILFRDL